MPLATLGKRKHKVLRDSGITGSYIEGEWVESPKVEIDIYANVQPSYGSPLLKHLPEGEREKESVLIFSDHWIYTATSGVAEDGSKVSLKADILKYRGCEWEVSIARPFGNFGTHVEAIAVKLNDELVTRFEGIVGVTN